MTVVYRVENAKGEGPYRTSAFWGMNGESAWEGGEYRWPAPLDDFPWLEEIRAALGSAEVLHRFHFGFPSIEAAKRWFGEGGLADLEKQGFTLRALQVPHAIVSRSGRQVIFCRAFAEEVVEGVKPRQRRNPLYEGFTEGDRA